VIPRVFGSTRYGEKQNLWFRPLRTYGPGLLRPRLAVSRYLRLLAKLTKYSSWSTAWAMPAR